MTGIIETVLAPYRERGQESYFGEDVTQGEHALQAAALAEQANASDALIVAALLHDVGHLIHQRGEDIADRGVDAQHERIGAKWLARFFPPAVTEPIRLHVTAKRYLLTVEPAYRESLSAASRQSASLQGGSLGAEEQRAFLAEPFHRDAIELRRWDDAAKIVGLRVPDFDHYLRPLQAIVAP